MKKLTILLLFILIAASANSQILISLLLGDKLNSEGMEFGLEGGINWAKISELETDASRSALNLGFYFDIRMKNQFWLHTGFLAVTTFGVDNLKDNDLNFLDVTTYDAEGDYNQTLNYFALPVLAKYKFKNHIYLEVGPQFGMAYRPYVEFLESNDEIDARIREYNMEKINRMDAGIRTGIGYKLLQGKGMNIGIAYYYGFANVYKDRSGTNNQSFFIVADIPIGRGKVKSEQSEK